MYTHTNRDSVASLAAVAVCGVCVRVGVGVGGMYVRKGGLARCVSGFGKVGVRVGWMDGYGSRGPSKLYLTPNP